MLQLLDIAPVDFAPDAPVRLARLRTGSKLKLPDCCVLLAAQTTGAAIATFDDRLANEADKRGVQVLGG